MDNRDQPLQQELERQLRRRAAARRGGFFGLLLTGGTVGLLFCVPLVGGAYLGRWLDQQIEGYSARWTVSLIVLGIVVGAYNVYRFLSGLHDD